MAFHDADTDTNTDTDSDSDSPDTSIHPYVRCARFPREDYREEVRVGARVRVGAVECQLYARVRCYRELTCSAAK